MGVGESEQYYDSNRWEGIPSSIRENLYRLSRVKGSDTDSKLDEILAGAKELPESIRGRIEIEADMALAQRDKYTI